MTPRCPACSEVALRFLPGISEHAYVNYHRCDGCDPTFSVPKDVPTSTPTRVLRPS